MRSFVSPGPASAVRWALPLLLSFGAPASEALAADLFSPMPAMNWSGFYVGGNVGYAWSTRDADGGLLVPSGPGFAGGFVPSRVDGQGSAFAGGGQAGLNAVFGPILVGLEADAQTTNLGRSRGTGPATPGFTVVSAQKPIDYFGSVRGRLGYAWGQALFYGTAGFAYAWGRSDTICVVGALAGCQPGSGEGRTGRVLGLGAEYAFTGNLSARVEGLYVSLDRGQQNRNIAGFYADGTALLLNGARWSGDDFGLLRVGVNYKF